LLVEKPLYETYKEGRSDFRQEFVVAQKYFLSFQEAILWKETCVIRAALHGLGIISRTNDVDSLMHDTKMITSLRVF